VDDYDQDYFKQDVLWRHSVFTLRHNPSKLLVTEIDPDSSTRQHKSLHSDDVEDEMHLLRRLWTLVREGKLQEAQQLCRESGQPWRAATLSGGQLFHDAELGKEKFYVLSLL
jgi:nuclear pore complex protein Nup107